MNKNFLIIIALVVVAASGYFIFQMAGQSEQPGQGGPENGTVSFDPKNTAYVVEGKSYTLIDGKAEEMIQDSASKITTMTWGEPVFGDLDGDGIEDAAIILTQTFGATGVFYYATAAIRNPETGKAEGKNAILLGDRIAPQNISIADKTVLVNYAERKPGEPFTTKPSVGVSKWMVYQNGELKEMHICSAQEKIANVCTKEYNPVCGDDLETYGNGCEACKSNSANSWIRGECK